MHEKFFFRNREDFFRAQQSILTSRKKMFVEFRDVAHPLIQFGRKRRQKQAKI